MMRRHRFSVLGGMRSIMEYMVSDLSEYASHSRIRANAVGERLEEYIKDAISGAFDLSGEARQEAHSRAFSFLGNQNNPPDAIIRNGDAIEIKKKETPGGSIQLNSSYPRDVLWRDDSRIATGAADAMNAEGADRKDLFYAIGIAKQRRLEKLLFVDGKCYAARRETYERAFRLVSRAVKASIQETGLELHETNELANIRRVDPLGRTIFRIRGMWIIESPFKAFEENINDGEYDTYIGAVMRAEKFEALGGRRALGRGFRISRTRLPDPNNRAALIDAVVIEGGW